jgi:hypothetical protein
MFSMDISAVSAPPVNVKTPDASPVKTPDANEVKPAEAQNGAAADGTRLPQPTPRAPLPPGQGTRIDQLV